MLKKHELFCAFKTFVFLTFYINYMCIIIFACVLFPHLLWLYLQSFNKYLCKFHWMCQRDPSITTITCFSSSWNYSLKIRKWNKSIKQSIVFIERCSLITTTVCAFKLNNVMKICFTHRCSYRLYDYIFRKRTIHCLYLHF